MLRRWLIRGLFLFFVLLFIGTWVASYFVESSLWYVGRAHARIVVVVSGNIRFVSTYTTIPATNPWRWSFCPLYAQSVQAYREYYQSLDYHFLGFAYQPFGIGWGAQEWWIPLWFPTLLSALLLVYAWRKTRPKPRGFPVTLAPDAPPPCADRGHEATDAVSSLGH